MKKNKYAHLNINQILKNIRKFQQNVNILMNKSLFQKLIKKIIEQLYSNTKFRMQFEVLNALQKTFKIFLIENFES